MYLYSWVVSRVVNTSYVSVWMVTVYSDDSDPPEMTTHYTPRGILKMTHPLLRSLWSDDPWQSTVLALHEVRRVHGRSRKLF